MTTIKATAGKARETNTGVERGLDVPVTLVVDGREIHGEVTLLPAADGRPRYESWGAGPDHWVAGALLSAIRNLGEDEYSEALSAIEAAASDSCDRV